MNLNKLTKFSALKKAVNFARLSCDGDQEEYRSMIVGYYAAIEQLGAIKSPRPKHRAKQIGKKIKSTKRDLIKRGIFPGGRVPFGYSVKNGKLVINHEEDEAVTMMLRLYADGHRGPTISKMIFRDLGIKVSANCITKICLGKRLTPTS